MSIVYSPGQKILNQLGEKIRLARRRRRLSTKLLAERAGVSRATLWQIEKGTPTVSMGAYFMVLIMLGFERELQNLAAEDKFGRRLQDEELITRSRAQKSKL